MYNNKRKKNQNRKNGTDNNKNILIFKMKYLRKTRKEDFRIVIQNTKNDFFMDIEMM
jgi:hypothetical protein